MNRYYFIGYGNEESHNYIDLLPSEAVKNDTSVSHLSAEVKFKIIYDVLIFMLSYRQ